MNKKAEMGMGTLIIFIAMILVAAVAAGVLISTTGSLQNKALATGRATTQEVGTSLSAVEVFAEDGSNQDVEYFYETVKLSSGSDAVRFSDMLLVMNLDNVSQDYTYNGAIVCSATAGVTWTGHATNSAKFGIAYQIQGTSFKTGYLNKGDVVKVCFKAPRNTTEGENLKITLIPMVGTPLVVDSSTPDLMVDTRVTIFP